MLPMEIRNYLLNNRKLLKISKDLIKKLFIFRVSLFQLEKKRTEGLQFIVTILQKVFIIKIYLYILHLKFFVIVYTIMETIS